MAGSSGIGKVLLIGGLGYVGYTLYKNMSAPAAAAAPASAGGIQPTAAPVIPAPTVNPSTTAQLILNAAGPNFTMGTVDEWDFFYGKARGIPAPDPINDWGFTQETRLQKMTFPEYWAIATAHGLSGLAGIVPTRAGLGYVSAPARLALMELQ